jgi:hypothetical protein
MTETDDPSQDLCNKVCDLICETLVKAGVPQPASVPLTGLLYLALVEHQLLITTR